MQEISPAKWPSVLAAAAGGLSAALGLTVLVGWYTHNTALIQIHPTFVTMVYNTALGFFLSGLSLVAIALGRPRLALIGGGYVVVFGLVTLAEFMFSRDLGIDQLFMRDYVMVANAYPNRMALNSAVFWPLVGSAILLMSLSRARLRPLIVGLIGSIAFAQGLVAFSGYLTGVTTTYAWGNLTRMAVHTAFGFAILGLGLVALAWRDHRAEERKGAPRWLPIVVGVTVAAITLCLWQALVIDRRAQTKRTVETRNALVSNEITLQILAHVQAVGRLARLWHMTGMKNQQQRQSTAGLIVDAYVAFNGISWVDFSDHIGWTIPLQGHEAEPGTYFPFDDRRKAVLEAARNTGRPAVSRPVDLSTGGKVLLVLAPLYDADNLEGYVNGVIDIRRLLDTALSQEVTGGYAVVVSEGNYEIYRQGPLSDLPGSKWANTNELTLPGMDWRVKVYPESAMAANLQSSVPMLTLLAGLIISFMLSWTVWFAQAARSRSKIVEATSIRLKSEVAERTNAENALSAALEKERVLLNNAEEDIAKRKQLELELIGARDTALESTRLKSEFLANMSHEIRTPMNGVIGMTDLLLRTRLTPQQKQFTDTINGCAESLMTVINDILDFSKIEAGLLRFEKIDFDLRVAVEASVDLLADRAHTKGLELASLVHQDVSTSLQGDPGRLRQVLTNLIGNAIKFTDSGEVVVRATRISETATHTELRFEIQDTGIGISLEAQGRLFCAFTQADGSTTRQYGGTGLGLAISKQLIELMGGQIGIQSTFGHGSTFWFTTEFEKQGEPLTAPGAAEQEATGNLLAARVLIVDDNATNRSILDHQTSSWGMIATEAESGKRALELLRAAARLGQSFDIAILDLMMPRMNGLQLAEAIKSDPLIAATILVLLPSFTESGQGNNALHLGIAACLQKPVRQANLYDCLVSLIGRSAGAEPMTLAHPVTRQPSAEGDVPDSELQQPERLFSNARIIVADDNVVNQNVAIAQLYNLGYRADVVQNGRELLKALETADFDLIFMDCQMPQMDGFAATAEIRRLECGLRHTPIIAMTANALDGDDRRCLAAGMDDYLSKPVKADVLRKKLERWIKPFDRPQSLDELSEATVPDVAARAEVIDQSQLVSLREIRRPGKGDFVTHLIDLFVNETISELKVLHEAVSINDATEIRRVAHFLKSGSTNIGAIQMTALYEQLEGTRSTNGDSKALLIRLDHEFELVREALKAERRDTPG